jgi:hypothetical protein
VLVIGGEAGIGNAPEHRADELHDDATAGQRAAMLTVPYPERAHPVAEQLRLRIFGKPQSDDAVGPRCRTSHHVAAPRRRVAAVRHLATVAPPSMSRCSA